jgi:uncharacterized protein
MLVLGTQAIGWIPVDEQKDAAMVLMAFVFPLELVATIFAFLARDTLGATTLGLFTTSWLTFGWTSYAAKPGATAVTTGIYEFGFAAVVILIAALATAGKPFFTLLLCIAATRMILAGLYEVGAVGKTVFEVAGGFALGLATLAFYGGTAFALEDARQAELLPLFRRGAAAESFDGYGPQLERLEREAGVRQQL